jgi:hypothetical protein
MARVYSVPVAIGWTYRRLGMPLLRTAAAVTVLWFLWRHVGTSRDGPIRRRGSWRSFMIDWPYPATSLGTPLTAPPTWSEAVGVLGPHVARMVAAAFELPFQRHHGWIPLRQAMSARLCRWRRDACGSSRG